MAEVTNELLYEVLKPIYGRLDKMDVRLGEVRHEVAVVRSYLAGMQQDVNNINGILARHDARLDRIERRLDLVETH